MQRLPNSRGCFVCGLDNPDGFNLAMYRDDDTIFTEVVIPDKYRGYDGVAHGGIVALLLDDIMGWAANCAAGGATATGEMTVRYGQPTPIGQPLRLEARVTKGRSPLYYVESCLKRQDGSVCATATGKLLKSGENFGAEIVHAPDAVRLFGNGH